MPRASSRRPGAAAGVVRGPSSKIGQAPAPRPARAASFHVPTRRGSRSFQTARAAGPPGSALPVIQRIQPGGAFGSGKVSVASARPYWKMSSKADRPAPRAIRIVAATATIETIPSAKRKRRRAGRARSAVATQRARAQARNARAGHEDDDGSDRDLLDQRGRAQADARTHERPPVGAVPATDQKCQRSDREAIDEVLEVGAVAEQVGIGAQAGRRARRPGRPRAGPPSRSAIHQTRAIVARTNGIGMTRIASSL